MKQKIMKLYRAAKRLTTILSVILLLGQIPVAYLHLIDQVQAVQQVR